MKSNLELAGPMTPAKKRRAIPKARTVKTARPSSSLGLRRILVPVDFSESSEIALRYAMQLARQFGAKLSVVHVVETPYVTGEPIAMDAVGQQLRDEGKHRVKMLASRFGLQSLLRKQYVHEGSPYHYIVETAREDGSDLIILGTHGRSGLARVFVGSTAERVVRHAPCAVMVVRNKERAGKAQSKK